MLVNEVIARAPHMELQRFSLAGTNSLPEILHYTFRPGYELWQLGLSREEQLIHQNIEYRKDCEVSSGHCLLEFSIRMTFV